MSKVTRQGSSSEVAHQTTYDYPSEVIDLPSGGLLYPDGHPLSGGTIEIKYMTAREEDILTSQNLVNRGIVLDKLFESIILSDVDPNDIVVGDKNAVYLASRIMAYGPEYQARIRCPECGTNQTIEVDLSALENKQVEPPPSRGNQFGLKLPQSGKEITFKVLTHGDSKAIDQEIEQWDKLNESNVEVPRSEMSIRYKYIITSVDGETNKAKIKRFVTDGLTIRDARELMKRVKAVSPGVDQTFDFECSRCDYAERVKIPFGIDFFWPTEEL